MADIAGYPEAMDASTSERAVAEMAQNESFSFPRIEPSASHRRFKSMSAALPRPIQNSHQRGASALPSFMFNANDTSGLTANPPVDREHDDEPPLSHFTPSRGAHKRNTSEFVGGLGMTSAISSSPTRSTGLNIPHRKHRYGHSRSQLTLSSHDLSSIMSPPEPQPRLSSSLPSTPLERPNFTSAPDHYASSYELPTSSSEDLSARPPSRPRVEFSDSVEYIPRPLSTISSETGSSLSTVRGHSVNNSISSMLSASNGAPAAARVRATSLGTTLEIQTQSIPRSSLEVSRRIEKEGQWLRHGSVGDPAVRPLSEPTSRLLPVMFPEGSATVHRQSALNRKERSVSGSLGFDRRRSEPVLGMENDPSLRLSALSLQEQAPAAADYAEEPSSDAERRSSSRRLKDWASSKLFRRSKEPIRPVSAYSFQSAQENFEPATSAGEHPAAETDLDAVFSVQTSAVPGRTVRASPVFDVNTPYFTASNTSLDDGDNDYGTLLDLDAALGPFNTPNTGIQRTRRELHSSRGTKDFVGPGGHYLPNTFHRRTESAPMLTVFDQGRLGTPPQTMADVFEEDEEEAEVTVLSPKRPTSAESMQDDEAGVGVRIVDSDITANNSTASLGLEDGMRGQGVEWELERPTTSYGISNPRLSMPLMDRRSSVIEDTIIEESSPTEPTIVELHEEPRAHSLTKSSDSSETPTLLASQVDMLPLPHGQRPSDSRASWQPGAFPSPDMIQRQGSFETSRAGTSASSIADNRTMSSCTTGEPAHDTRISVDDVPSLTSSRSTMISTMHANTSRRDVAGARTPSSGTTDGTFQDQYRRKRASIQSLSQLVGGPFGPRSDYSRPQTAAADTGMTSSAPRKEHRLKKLMFWKSKHRQASASTIS